MRTCQSRKKWKDYGLKIAKTSHLICSIFCTRRPSYFSQFQSYSILKSKRVFPIWMNRKHLDWREKHLSCYFRKISLSVFSRIYSQFHFDSKTEEHHSLLISLYTAFLCFLATLAKFWIFLRSFYSDFRMRKINQNLFVFFFEYFSIEEFFEIKNQKLTSYCWTCLKEKTHTMEELFFWSLVLYKNKLGTLLASTFFRRSQN